MYVVSCDLLFCKKYTIGENRIKCMKGNHLCVCVCTHAGEISYGSVWSTAEEDRCRIFITVIIAYFEHLFSSLST